MKQLLIVPLLSAALYATAQRDTTNIERLMYHYDSLHKAAFDSMVSHKDNADSDIQHILDVRRYYDSLNKYLDLRMEELDKKLDSLLNSPKKINKRT